MEMCFSIFSIFVTQRQLMLCLSFFQSFVLDSHIAKSLKKILNYTANPKLWLKFISLKQRPNNTVRINDFPQLYCAPLWTDSCVLVQLNSSKDFFFSFTKKDLLHQHLSLFGFLDFPFLSRVSHVSTFTVLLSGRTLKQGASAFHTCITTYCTLFASSTSLGNEIVFISCGTVNEVKTCRF